MIEINLLPEQLRKREKVKIALPEIPIKKTLYALSGGVVALQLLLTLAAVYVRLELASLEKETALLRLQNREIVLQKAEATGIYNRLKEMRALTSRNFYWASLLNAIAHSMTKGVWLRGLYVEEQVQAPRPPSAKGEKPAQPQREKYLVLAGSAIGAGQETAFIGKFLKELKDNPLFNQLFSDLKPSNISQKRSGEYEVYEFTISCQFRKDKEP